MGVTAYALTVLLSGRLNHVAARHIAWMPTAFTFAELDHVTSHKPASSPRAAVLVYRLMPLLAYSFKFSKRQPEFLIP